MQKAFNNFTWENLPSTNTALEADRLNVINNALDTVDDRVVAFDTTKANQSDMLQAVKTISFNSQTGTFRFTFFNNTYLDVDTDIEKIAINFDYDDDPTSAHYQNLIITLDDGTVKYVDMSALLTQYEFNNSSRISFSVVNGVVSADIINGSVTEEKLQPNFLADCRSAKAGAETAETNAKASEDEANAWANGEIDGVPVPSTHPAYHNNAKYYKDLANPTSLMALTDTDITNPASGDVLTFNGEKWENKEGINGEEKTAVDTFETINGGLLSSLKVALTPNQDLHGYDSPWVGGAGKNKLPLTVDGIKSANTSGTWNGNDYTYNSVVFTIQTDNDGNITGIKVNGTPSSDTYFYFGNINFNGSYKVSGYQDSIYSRITVFVNNMVVSNIDNDDAPYLLTVTLSDTVNISIKLLANWSFTNNIVAPIVCLSTESDPTFEPYSNICPISGHTQVKVGDDGINLISGIENGAVDDYGSPSTSAYRCRTVEFIHIKPNTQYTLKASSDDGTLEYLVRTFEDADGSYRISDNDGWHQGAFTFTSQANAHDLKVIFRFSDNASIDASQIYNVQLELGSTATDYVPYNGYQVTVNLGGTYYSGTLDVVSGVFVPDTAYLKKNSVNSVSSLSGTYYWTVENGLSSINGANALSSHFKSQNGLNGGNCYIAASGTQLLVVPADQTLNTKALANTWMANNEPEFVYKLATPTPIQLSPTMVKALVGENHLSAPLEGQEIDEVKYNSIAKWNDVVQDDTTSLETTWSSDKINTDIETVASSVTALASRVGTNETNIAGLTTRVGALETNASKITWSNSVNALVDDTTVTISNANITTTSIIEPFYSNASGDNVVIKNQTATAGQVVLTFDALLEATSFRVRITNL